MRDTRYARVVSLIFRPSVAYALEKFVQTKGHTTQRQCRVSANVYTLPVFVLFTVECVEKFNNEGSVATISCRSYYIFDEKQRQRVRQES